MDEVITIDLSDGFTCIGCGHDLPTNFCIRTEGYCYLCDPNVTVEELLSGESINTQNNE